MPRPEVEEQISRAGRITLFLDFDGTLTPLVANPDAARLDDATRETLAQLSRKEHIVTTIISGRALDDLRRRVGLPRLIYAGNHGLEIDGRQLHFVEPVAAVRRGQLRRLTDWLATGLRRVAGVLVENKDLTASIHYRRAAEASVPFIEKFVRESMLPVTTLFRVDRGKQSLEVTPRTGWNKGSAVRWIRARLGEMESLCIYFGDDRTDEDAFRALPEAMTFRVGPAARTDAKYRVPGPAAVHEFLRWLESRQPGLSP
jgi:trehalose-phosphatase